MFPKIRHATTFSKLDASQAVWQVKLSDEGKNLTNFNTPLIRFGRYAYDCLPYGLTPAPEVFHSRLPLNHGANVLG